MKQGGTNGSKEESSKEKENHKEESSKEESSEEEKSCEEEKEKISTRIQLVFDKASCPSVLCRENKNMGLLFIYHRNSDITFSATTTRHTTGFPLTE